jgi:protein-arginine kinase activator protein McsA
MAYPSSHPAGSFGPSHPSYRCHLQGGPQAEGDHQLEKLEFALAVALTRGDSHRSAQLRDQIAALGGNLEEPGT